MSRIICQFSCGAASAVATKLAIAQYSATHDVQIVNAFVKQEHDDNANCKGCVKGGEGYWRAIRHDFPEEFEELCLVQDELGDGSWFLRYRSGPKKDQRFPLRDLPDGPIVRNEGLPSCSFFCEIAELEYTA